MTVGQAPRADVVAQILAQAGIDSGEVQVDEFGALDDFDTDDLARHNAAHRGGFLYTQLRTGERIVVSTSLVTRLLEPIIERIDQSGFDLIVLASTGLFRPFRTRTPLVHAQEIVDAWIGTLVMGNCTLGLIHHLAKTQRGFSHGTLLQDARSVEVTGEATLLEETAERLSRADLILMHSVMYTDEMALKLAALTGRPVVTARRIIASAIRLQLQWRARRYGEGAEPPAIMPQETVLRALQVEEGSLTAREQEVLAHILEGRVNKEIGRLLGISHRTVEIHRGRIMTKLHVSSAAELMRRLAIALR